MEKIVTKIGDVTIERRVTKPKALMDKSFGNNGQDSNQYLTDLSSGLPKSEDLGKLPELAQSNWKPDITITNKNVNRTFTIGENSEIKLDDSPKRPATSNSHDFGCNFSSSDDTENLDSDIQCVSNECQNPRIFESNESGVSLPKVPRIAPVTADLGNNEPDLSKFVGISVERKRKLDCESQTSKALTEDESTIRDDTDSGLLLPKIRHDESVSLSDDANQTQISGEPVFDKNYPDVDDVKQEGFSLNRANESSDDPENLTNEPREEPPFIEDSRQIKQEENVDEEKEERSDVDVLKEESEIKNEVDEGNEDGEKEDGEPETDVKEEDMNDFDLVELMQKGEIEGEIEDVKNEDEIEDESEEQKATKRKAGEEEEQGEEEEDGENADEEDNGEENEDNKGEKPSKKKKKKSDKKEGEDKNESGEAEGDDKNIDKSKVTNANLRKNIREVMDETKLDEATLSAQRQEAERLKRLQEQQRIIREVQRQIALNRQNQKSQNKVLSLLQGNSQTSILKTSSTATQVQNAQTKTQNSVLVKLSNGEQTSLNNKKMIELLKNSKNKTILGKPPIPKTLFKQGMVTPSVSIAPVVKKDPVVDDKKKKKGDVVTLSSDSEDDCIVLSDEDESEPEEDPTNSGMHTNDKYNLPDEQGRVLVNVGHPETESDLYLAPQIAKIIKPHQIGGIRFLYDNVIESIDRYSTSAGFGCILAHSMGLGKTLQIVSFSDIFLRYTSAKTILCIMPINTIQNWLAEFNLWLPKESHCSSEEVRCREFDLFIVNESLKNINARSRVILDWKKSGGVLLMGYELFRLLSLKKSYKSKKKRKRDVEEDDAKNKELMEEIYSALVVPGPDLVICDEGHRIKNSHATTSQALKQIRTKRRIVLTGYPLQNNLLEYWCMVDFVRPNYLGTKTEFSNMFERPIQNGQCIDSTPQDKRLMRYRAHVLHSLLEGFVQRRSHAVLQATLPEKEEYVLLLRFTPFQRKLYDTFMNEVVRTVAVPNPLKAFAVCCKIWNHPDVLYNFLKKKGEEIDLDLEEALPPSLQIPQYPYGQQNLGLEGTNQQMQAWPRRGPGSRGGKSRQNNPRSNKAQTPRGRKPAASISPSVSTGPDKISPEGGYNSGQFPLGNDFSPKNFTAPTNLNSFPGRNYNANQFGYGNEYNGQPGYGNTNYNKSSLNNLEEMSAGNFQGKRFYSPNNDGGNQVHGYGADGRFPQSVGTESSLNSSFDSNMSSTDSTKGFEYGNQEYSADYYQSGNFQAPGPMTGYQRDAKPPVFQNNPYYQNPNFRGSGNFEYSGGNAMNPSFSGYDRPNSNYQNAGPQNSSFQAPIQGSGTGQRIAGNSGQVPSYQSQNLGGNFQNSSSTTSSTNYSGNFQGSTPSFEENRFSGQPPNSSGFQGGNSNFNKSFPGNPSNFGKSGNFQGQNSQGNFPGSGGGGGSSSSSGGGGGTGSGPGNYGDQNYWSQSNWNFGQSSKGSQDYRTSSASNDFMPQPKFNSFDETQPEPVKAEAKNVSAGSNSSAMYTKINCDYSSSGFEKTEAESKDESTNFENGEGNKPKDEEEKREETGKTPEKKEDASLPYDWATDLFKNYVTGVIENSSKMEVFIHIVTESIKLGDRLLVFSQSLLTLDLIENYLHKQNVPGKDEIWAKARNYFRLDGSTPGLEREKLINEFNSNPNIHMFLVSTRAGSLGINLVGANRVIVFDASWNPCHDTQAVCRVYRYGQQKPCYVYRLVMDSCLEKKIYDRQVNKQGMADRVVDELNPDAHLSIKEVTNLCWDDQEDTTVKDYSDLKDKYNDEIIKILLEKCSKVLSKEPFQHESLLIDRKEKKLSQAEKRLAKRSYELEKQAANQPKNIYTFFPNSGQRNFVKPIASVRPMQSEMDTRMSPQMQNRTKWIPAEVWQKQGMSAQEMTLPLDVVIPTSSPEKTSIVLKAGQRVMVLKSPKGIYMQLENGKIIAIRSAFKVGQNSSDKSDDVKKEGCTHMSPTVKSTGSITVTPKMAQNIRHGIVKQPFTKPFTKFPEKKVPVNVNMVKGRQVMGKAKPFVLNRKFENVGTDVKQRLMVGGEKPGLNNQEDKFDSGEPTIVEEKLNIPDKGDSSVEDGSFTDEAVISSSDEKTDDKTDDKCEMTDSLETLRKVTEKISDSAKREPEPEPEVQYQQSSLKNYRHNFASQVKDNSTVGEEKVTNTIGTNPPTNPVTAGTGTGNRISSGVGGSVNRTSVGVGVVTNRTNTGVQGASSGGGTPRTVDTVKEDKRDMTNSTSTTSQQHGNENIQNWLTNQSYPPAEPYGNYFPGYYAYGPGPGPMVPPYDGLYPPNNYGHSVGRNPSVPAPNPKPQPSEPAKSSSQPVQPVVNPIPQNVQTSTPSRNTSVVNTPPMYPAYPNPYSYHYNYATNPNFNSQSFSIPNQSQSSQQATQSGANSSSSTPGQTPPASYDNSMYSAFHRPDAPSFQATENAYSSPYPRPPYPTGNSPGFFPYNPAYPNYPYSANFNPYMHPTGYGYHPSAGQGSNAGVGSGGGGGGGVIGGATNSTIPHSN